VDVSRRAILPLVVLLFAPAANAAVVAYPGAQTIRPSGSLPPQGAASAIALSVAAGETEDAQIVVTGATQISAAVETQTLQPMSVRLLWAHYVRFGSRFVPDALEPWNGSARAAEQPNQPVWLQIGVRSGTPPGTYRGAIAIAANGRTTTVPVAVRVFDVELPPFRTRATTLHTAFGLGSQTYVNKVDQLYGIRSVQQYVATDASLFRFLAEHRVSPASYGYGDPGPRTAGYQRSTRWWLDSATNLERELDAAGGPFPDMRVPLSNNRASAVSYLAGKSPYHPEAWCDYLRSVRGFWQQHGWLADALPYVYGFDEPGSAQRALLGRQASALHGCFAGAQLLVTTSPTAANRSLWDGRNNDDVDIWVPLARRWYGTFGTEQQPRREHDSLDEIDAARAHGKTVWTYTYTAVKGSPGFAATEPLADSQMFFLWAALENIPGVLYGEGSTSYDRGNPFQSVSRDGRFVLLYPGAAEPIASARLEQIRDGIEDWSLYALVRRRFGAARVRAILGGAGLFSASARGVSLACVLRCDLRGPTKFAWPRWSDDATTANRIDRAKLEALQLLAG
jgi:hypothetical protein